MLTIETSEALKSCLKKSKWLRFSLSYTRGRWCAILAHERGTVYGKIWRLNPEAAVADALEEASGKMGKLKEPNPREDVQDLQTENAKLRAEIGKIYGDFLDVVKARDGLVLQVSKAKDALETIKEICAQSQHGPSILGIGNVAKRGLTHLNDTSTNDDPRSQMEGGACSLAERTGQ